MSAGKRTVSGSEFILFAGASSPPPLASPRCSFFSQFEETCTSRLSKAETVSGAGGCFRRRWVGNIGEGGGGGGGSTAVDFFTMF